MTRELSQEEVERLFKAYMDAITPLVLYIQKGLDALLSWFADMLELIAENGKT